MRLLSQALIVASASAASWGVQGGTPGRLLTNAAIKAAAGSDVHDQTDPPPAPRAPGRMTFPLITPPTPTFAVSAQVGCECEKKVWVHKYTKRLPHDAVLDDIGVSGARDSTWDPDVVQRLAPKH